MVRLIGGGVEVRIQDRVEFDKETEEVRDTFRASPSSTHPKSRHSVHPPPPVYPGKDEEIHLGAPPAAGVETKHQRMLTVSRIPRKAEGRVSDRLTGPLL